MSETRPGTGVVADAAAFSEAGPIRSANEDAALASPPAYLVADGMGGHSGGARASLAALGPFAALAGPSAEPQEVYRAMREAGRAVESLADADGERPPGTTLSGLVLTHDAGRLAWLLINLGDSRTYRFAGGQLELRTEDHSEVAELVRAGVLTPAQAASYPRRNVVTRALGRGMPSVPDYDLVPVQAGDRWLVCSDGLSGGLSHEQIAAVLAGGLSASETARALVAEAIEAGSRDNVTALVLDVADSAGGAPLEDDTVRRGKGVAS